MSTFKTLFMDCVLIERRTYEKLLQEVKSLASEIREMKTRLIPESGDWIDSQEVCLHLDISKRALQYYRSNGHIPYSMIGNKIYYSRKDIARILKNGLITTKPNGHDERNK